MVPQTMTEMETAMLRTNAIVAVAVATSACLTWLWMAMRGASKRIPCPRPAIIWNPTARPVDVLASKDTNSPNPRHMKNEPTHMISRKRPVRWIMTPHKTPKTAPVTMSGRSSTPERRGMLRAPIVGIEACRTQLQ